MKIKSDWLKQYDAHTITNAQRSPWLELMLFALHPVDVTCYLHVTMIFNGVFKFAPYGANLIYMNTAATNLTVSIFTNIKIQNWMINHLRDLSCPYIYVILVRITMEKFLYTK